MVWLPWHEGLVTLVWIFGYLGMKVWLPTECSYKSFSNTLSCFWSCPFIRICSNFHTKETRHNRGDGTKQEWYGAWWSTRHFITNILLYQNEWLMMCAWWSTRYSWCFWWRNWKPTFFWKHREFVKLISKQKDLAFVEEVTRLLEYDSGGILVDIASCSKERNREWRERTARLITQFSREK